MLGPLGLALGDQHFSHAIVQPRHDRERLERLLIDTLGLGMLTTLVQQAAKGRIDPRLGATGKDAGEEFFQLFEAVQVAQRISAIAQAQRAKRGSFLHSSAQAASTSAGRARSRAWRIGLSRVLR